jgi:hypothetical protein
MPWVLIVLWLAGSGMSRTGTNLAVAFANRDLCEAVKVQLVDDVKRNGGMIFSANCHLQFPAGRDGQ